MDELGLREVQKYILALAKVYEEHAAELTELDAAIGDADHGSNINRGFSKVVEQITATPPTNIAELLKTVSMQLIKTVGGTSGPLFGTFFLKASMSVRGKENITAEDLAKMFRAGMDGVTVLGKATQGEKTMIDTFLPAVESMETNTGAGMKYMLEKGVAAAEQGMKATIDMRATKGRASYLGERSIGHQDPGATSAYYMLKTALEVLG